MSTAKQALKYYHEKVKKKTRVCRYCKKELLIDQYIKRGKICHKCRAYRADPERKAQAARDYQHEYYLEHKDKALEYQRLYNLRHKKKRGPYAHVTVFAQREAKQLCFNAHDLMDAKDDKAVRMIEKIIAGERLFTM